MEARRGTPSLLVAMLALVLAGCAGQLAAPVESRVAGGSKGEAATGSEVSALGSASAGPKPTKPLDPLPAPVSVSAEGEIDSSGTPSATEGGAENAQAAPRRLAALNPAIRELLDEANQHSEKGRHDGAAAALERALQIEPRDAALWHRLARTRLDQGRIDLAEALAAKSNSLALGDPNLQAQNWRVIAKVREQQGDASGAQDALARAARLVQ